MKNQVCSALLSLFLLISALSFAQAAQTYVLPLTISDSGIAENDSLANDASSATAANISLATGNVALYQYNTGPLMDSIDIIQVSVLFDAAVTGTSDDEWALQYSNDSGASWYDLRALATGDASQQNFSYPLPGAWYWSNFSSAFRVRVLTNTVGEADGANIFLYETWLNVTYDGEGPNVTLLSPATAALLSSSTVVFTYTVNDTLSGIKNCSLFLNNTHNQTNTSVIEETEMNFTVTVIDSNYTWFVSCVDNSTALYRRNASAQPFVVDLNAPVVTAYRPNETTTTTPVRFNYSMTDRSQANCSLIVNSTVENVTHGVLSGSIISVLLSLANSDYNWSVNCTDDAGWLGSSQSWNFTLAINYPPTVESVFMPAAVDLTAGSFVNVSCNASVTEPNALGQLAGVNATLLSTVLNSSSLDNASRYQNASCTELGNDSVTANFTCGFLVGYHAFAGPWNCSVTARDEAGSANTSMTNFTMADLFAMNITPDVIDYGLIGAGRNSTTDTVVTITNIGNREIDVMLDGYAQFPADGYAMNCTGGNISIGYERYSLLDSQLYASMTPLTATPTQEDDLNLYVKNTTFNGSANMYWKMGVPLLISGNCTGYVRFSLVAS